MAGALDEGEGQARHRMVGVGRLDRHVVVLVDRRPAPRRFLHLRLREVLDTFQKGDPRPVGPDLVDPKGEFLEREERIFVAGHAGVNPADGVGRPEDREDLVPVEVRADDAVEADEVVHVVVGEEDGAQAGEAVVVEAPQVAGVEEEEPPDG